MTNLEALFQELDDKIRPYNSILVRLGGEVTEDKLQKAQSDYNKKMIALGWYPHSDSFPGMFTPTLSDSEIDSLMISRMEDCTAQYKSNSVTKFPNREHILVEAFKLHNEKRYLAAIPLFLTQIDGIMLELPNVKQFFFSNAPKEKIANLNLPLNCSATKLMIESLTINDNPYNQGMRKKGLAPNRNGILHGYRKHLDYGSKANSFKLISLLMFVIYLHEILSKDDLHE